MVDPQTTRFWQTAIQSGLVDAAALRACWDSIPEAKRTADAADRRLARQTVEKRYLTLWQAQQIMNGRSSGYKIDKYVLIDIVGHGGMGRVYLAKDTRLNRQVALKVLSRERMSNPRAIARFRREAKVGAQLQHENLVRIYDEGEANGICYLVMEFINGRNIGQILSDIGAMPPAIAAGLARQVALGLEHARHKGLIHRDVNPLNVLVSQEGIAKLTDLGLAIDLGDPEDIVTRDGATVGTFDYIAPEQARHSRSVDTRSDIYALGCTLYHMLSGRVPFPQPSLPEKLYAHQSLDPEPITSLVPEVNPGIEAAIQKMMRKSMEERFQTPLEVAKALEPYAPTVPPTLIEILATATATRVATTASGALEAAATVVSSRAGAGGTPDSADLASARSSSGLGASPSPSTELSGSDPLGMIPKIDLGPAPPLSLSASVSASNTRVLKNPFPQIPRRQLLLAAAVAGALLILATLAVILSSLLGGSGGGSTSLTNGSPRVSKTGNDAEGQGPQSRGPNESHADIEVFNAGGEAHSEATLVDAFRWAVGRRGCRIVLGNTKPIELDVANPLDLSGGELLIEARPGTRPSINVLLTGGQPFLKVNPQATLTVRGLTFGVIHSDLKTPAPPVVIEALGNLKLDRCEFTARASERNMHALVLEGLRTTITGCVFRGFDCPIVFRAYPSSTVDINQSLFVRDQAGTPSSWAVCAEHRSAEATKGDRRISFHHCTVVAGGLLAVERFTKEQPLTVVVDHVSLRAPALLLTQKDAFPKSVHWSGKSNRYQITSAAWVRQAPQGFDNVPDSPSELGAWRTVTGSEADSAEDAFKLAHEGDPPYEAHDIAGFSMAPRTGEETPGIDPAKVGPPTKKKPE
jgi:serine/threonine-protein kinase